MNVIALKYLDKYIRKSRDAADQLRAWYHETVSAEWVDSMDIKKRYASASFLEDNVVVFNIKGKHYRLVVKVDYARRIVRIKWFGTHARYTAEMKKKKHLRFQDY